MFVYKERMRSWVNHSWVRLMVALPGDMARELPSRAFTWYDVSLWFEGV